MTNPTTQARDLADDVLQSAQGAVESTRNLANDSLDRASEKVRDLRRDVSPTVDRIAETAQDWAQRGLDAWSDTRERARRQIDHYSDVTGRYVADQPVKSVLIAAAAGAAVAAAVLLATRSSRPRNRY
ncbi:hypothetical protein [Xylophilus sp.]|uniref:hypothetical protein n=1 Tax=Xylophilus sp. TaxID=2653893 RepID=UPI0013BA6C30|nr:hypothetical protein [Xylophilus sp.]KAF1044760.1 MAG: hypothetical protein GAK38_03360 [Xylophilus sp.]